MRFLPNILGGFMGKPKESPELDKTKEATKKALQGLKNEIDISKAFEKDLDELGIKDPKEREEYLRILKERLLAESPELANVEEFIGNVAKYTKLDKLIEECKNAKSGDPFEKWAKTIAQVSPAMAGIIGWILSFKIGEPEEGKKMSKLDTKLSKLAAILRGEEEKKEEDKEKDKGAPKKTKEQEEKEKEEAEALAKASKDGVKKAFEEAGITFDVDEGKYIAGIYSLHQAGINTPEQIAKFVKEATDGKFGTVYKALKERMGEKAKEIKFSITDAYLYEKRLSQSQITEITEGLTKITYKSGSGPMQEFFKQVPKLVTNNKAIEKYIDEIEGTKTDKA
jgi:hypothetical protein